MVTLRLERAALPHLPPEAHGEPVKIWTDPAGNLCAVGYAAAGGWVMDWPGHATFRFGRSIDEPVTARSPHGTPPALVEDTFRRSVLPLALQAAGYETLHASAVDSGAGVLAFTGERGAGKSTVAYALHRRGFAQHADDTLVMSVTATGVIALPIPFAPRLRDAPARHFRVSPTLPGSCGPTGRPLAAVFVLRPASGSGRVALHRLDGAAALRALLAQAHCFDPTTPATRERVLRNYLEIAAQVPVYDLAYRPGLDALDALLDAVLAEADDAKPVARE
jgi:hypothetical protein